jgi:hypothetical protein
MRMALCAGMVLVGIAAPTITAAQQTPANDAENLLNRRAGIGVRSIPLESALLELWHRSNVPIAFSPDALGDSSVVSCSCVDASVREALDSLLSGTQLTYRATRNRVIIVWERHPGNPAPPPARRAVQRRVSIEGRVLAAPDSQPVVSARVQVSGRMGEVRTDARGRFQLSLGPGSYDLKVRALGFAPTDVPVRVAEGRIVEVTALMERAPVRLDEIVVAPSTFGILKPEVISRPHTLTRDELNIQPHIGEDVFRAVDRVPGIATHEMTSKIHVRGGPEDQLLQLLDGLELHEPFHLKDVDAALSIIDVESVGDVDLLTGGFGVEYGDKLTGVYDMRTTTPPPDRTTTSLGVSLMNLTFKSQGGFAGGRGTWLASARRGFLDIVLGMAGGFEGFSPTYYDVLSKVQYQLSDGHLLSGHMLHAGDKLTASDEDDRSIKSSWSTGYLWFTWDADFGSTLTANTIVSAGRLTRNRQAEALDNNGTRQTMGVDDNGGFEFGGLKQDWSVLTSERMLFKWGFDLKQGRADYDYLRWHGMGVANTTDPLGPTLIWIHDTTMVLANRDGREVGLYLSTRIQPAEGLTTEVGVRYDHQSHTGDKTMSPRFNAALQLGDRTTLRGAWGLFHQSHGLHELMAADGDRTFYGAQRAEHHIVGLEHRFTSGVALRIEGYERRIANPRPEYRSLLPVIELVPEAGFHDRVRVEPSRSRARGLEFSLKRSGTGRFAWSANYALAVSEDEIDGAWAPRPFDQRHTVNLEIAYRPNATWSFSSAWHYHSPWPTTSVRWDRETAANGDTYFTQTYGPPYAERMTPYHRLDARVSRHFPLGRGRLAVFLDVFNVYSRGNARTITYHPGVDSSGQVYAVRLPDKMLPVLPTIGARWEF